MDILGIRAGNAEAEVGGGDGDGVIRGIGRLV